MRDQVEHELAKVRNYVRRDGGDVQLVDITPDGVVKIKLTGTCAYCRVGTEKLRDFVEQMLTEEVSGVAKVEVISET